jgi:hypothetical protein
MERILVDYEFADGLTITETTSIADFSTGSFRMYNYYANGKYVFGTEDRFSQEDLEQLYMNGYFDPFFLR